MDENLSDLKNISLVYSLENCRLFAGLPREDLLTITAFTEVRSVEKGDYLFREGDRAAGLYMVQRGAVSLHRVNASGRAQVIRIFRTGDTFAEESLVAPDSCPADARAVESSQLLLVRKEGLLSLLQRRADLALRILTSMAGHLRGLMGQIEDLKLKDVETRLASWILKNCPDAGGEDSCTFQLTTTKQVLAAELGTISATLSRTLARLRSEGLIVVRGKTIVVPAPAKLRELIEARRAE